MEVLKLNEHIFLMDDDGKSTGYLVVGKEKAVIIDTMNGIENIKELAESLTNLPIMVINTHGHCDHIYGNIFFDEVWMNLNDIPVLEEHILKPEFIDITEKNGRKMPPVNDIRGGEIIDLGDLTLEVIDLPGHTAGSILLLLKEDRVLFTGDAINRYLWMQLEESLPLVEYIRNLDKIMYLMDEADFFLCGHTRDFDDIGLLPKLRAAAQKIVDAKGQIGEPYHWLGFTDKIYQYSDGAICFNEEKNS